MTNKRKLTPNAPMAHPEAAAMRAWRERLELSQPQLAERIGYTRMALYWFERGCVPPERNTKSGNAHDRAIKPWVWTRFKRTCGDLDAELHGRKPGEKFNW